MKKFKTLFFIAFSACFLLGHRGQAQCPFDPTVFPANLILCPYTQDTLWTQQYDSYQWYRNGMPIPGAVNQYYVVDYILDAGTYFSVKATDLNCTEMSPQALVDGWVFMPPVVQNTGDTGWFDGEYFNFCDGDTLILILLSPYDTLIQWFDALSPIPGATDDTLLVTYGGSFTVQGAPSICPGFIQQLGVTFDVIFHSPVIPVITISNDTLYATPSNAISYQWYFNNSAIAGATAHWYYPAQAGSYTVSMVDSNQCTGVSEPFTVVGIRDISAGDFVLVLPNPASEKLTIVSGNLKINSVEIYDTLGKLIYSQQKEFGCSSSIAVDISKWNDGVYIVRIKSEKGTKALKILKK